MPLLTPHVPDGLIDYMKDLAKEVLRDKPENIFEFAALHFEKLLLERDGSMDKGYETFTEFAAYFDGRQRFAVPSNYGFKCLRKIKIQPQTKISKSDVMASFQAMESINEEDVLSPVPTSTPTQAPTPAPAPAPPSSEGASSLYDDEKYQNAIYVIQRYFRRYKAKKENPPSMNTKNKKNLTAFTAAIIIQRTMQRLFSNKIKLKKKDRDGEKDSGLSSASTAVSAATVAATTAAIKLVHDDVDNVSEAASYTSSSTIQMLADGQEGRENRLASGQSRQQREEGLDDYVDCNGDVDGAADFSSLEFKEPTQNEEPPSSSPAKATETATATTTVAADVGDNEEHLHSVASAAATVTETDRKSIADENGN